MKLVSRNDGVAKALLTLGMCLLVALSLLLLWRLPPDLFGDFYPTAQNWLTGTTNLFDTQSPLFFHAPWMLGFLLPFSGFDFSVTAFVWNLLSLICLVASVALLWNRRHFSVAILACFSLPVLFALNNGSADLIIVLGLALAYVATIKHRPWLLSVAFTILLIKSFNVVLPCLLILWAVRKWKPQEWVRIAVIPLIATVVSSFFAGFDWPIRYVNFWLIGSSATARTTTVSIWRAANALAIPTLMPILLSALALAVLIFLIYRYGFNAMTFSLAIVTNLAFTTYAMEQHYVLLIPVFLFAAQNPILRWIIYLTTFFALFRLVGGWDVSWLMVIYPLILLIVLWGIALKFLLGAKMSSDHLNASAAEQRN